MLDEIICDRCGFMEPRLEQCSECQGAFCKVCIKIHELECNDSLDDDDYSEAE